MSNNNNQEQNKMASVKAVLWLIMGVAIGAVLGYALSSDGNNNITAGMFTGGALAFAAIGISHGWVS